MNRVYSIKPDVVNKVLGAGTYERWQKVQDAFIQEQSRVYTNQTRYTQDWAAGISAHLKADLAFAEKVDDDYNVFLERVSSSGAADVTEGEKILSVFVLAISILTSDNDILDDMFALGIMGLISTLGAMRLDAEARELKLLLERLQKALEKAKRETTEAYVQTAIGLAVTGILLCSGPLGWLTLGVVGLGQMVADTYLGPSTSDAATWGSRANTTLGTALSASENYVKEASKISKVIKPAGRVVPVVGFVFDVNEIRLGYSNEAAVKQLMSEAKKAQDRLLQKINQHKATFAALVSKFEQLRMEVEKRKKGYTAQTRETLEDEMRRSGYRPRI